MKPKIKILHFDNDFSMQQNSDSDESEERTDVDINKLEEEICTKLTETAKLSSTQHPSQANSAAVKMKKVKSKSAELICSECEFKCQSKKELKRHLKCHSGLKKLKCSKCDLEFKKKSLLKKHLLIHLSNDPTKTSDKINPPRIRVERKCQLCGFTTRQSQTFNRHIKLCQTTTRISCSDCDFTCLTRRELLKHIPSAHMNEDYKTCSECGYVASSLSSLEKHQLVHFSPQVYECSLCMFATKYPASLDRHIKFVHLNERLNQCPLCDYKSKEKGDLNKHMRVHGYSIFCPYCREKFTRVAKFQDHSCVDQFLESQQVYECFPDSLKDIFSSSSTNKNFQSYMCFECTREFDSRELLSRHMMKRHPQKCSFLCWLCGFCFNSFKKLREHSCKVKEKNEIPLGSEQSSKHKKNHVSSNKNSQIIYQCTHCDFQAKFVKSLSYHIRNVHVKNEDLFQCSQCSYKGKKKYDVTKHEMTVHQKNTYLCSKCGVCFEQLKKLRRHACNVDLEGSGGCPSSESDDENSNREAFKCNLCPFISTDQSRVVRHYQGVHENLRPYSCSQCKYKAKERGDLKKHFIWVHATVRGPYICSKCKQSFVLKTHLRTHECGGKRKASRSSFIKTPSIKRAKKEDLMDKIFLCTQCPFETKYQESIARHMECVHEGKRPYPCPKCNHKSKERGDLKKHLAKVHSVDNPYFCSYCHLSFKFHHELKTHSCNAVYSKEETKPDVIDILATKVSRPKIANPTFMVTREATKIEDEQSQEDDKDNTICSSPENLKDTVEASLEPSPEMKSPIKIKQNPMIRISRNTRLPIRPVSAPNTAVAIRLQPSPSKSSKRQASSQSAISFVEDSLMGGNKKVKVIAINRASDKGSSRPISPSTATLTQIKSEPEDADSNESCDFIGFEAIPQPEEFDPDLHKVAVFDSSQNFANDSSIIHKEIKTEYDSVMYDYANDTVVHEVTVGLSPDNSDIDDSSTIDKDELNTIKDICETVMHNYATDSAMHEVTVEQSPPKSYIMNLPSIHKKDDCDTVIHEVTLEQNPQDSHINSSPTNHKEDLNSIKDNCDIVIHDAVNDSVMHEVTIEQSPQISSEKCSPTIQKKIDSPKKTASARPALKLIKISKTKLEGLSCLGCKFFCQTLNELLVHLQTH